MQLKPRMAAAAQFHVLLIRAWIRSVEPVRAALQRVGLDVHISRVDLEPALHAALTRRAFDLILHDPDVPGLSRELVELRLREHRHAAPLVSISGFAQLGIAVLDALARLKN